MNKATRKQIEELSEQSMELIIAKFEEIRDEEQEKFENLPEGIQVSEKGEAFESAIESLEEIISELETAKESMDMFEH